MRACRRGLAGTLLVHKVAGAAAEAGLSLEEVLGEARAAAEAVGTMGVALSACTLPGKTAAQRIATGDMVRTRAAGHSAAEHASLHSWRGRGRVLVHEKVWLRLRATRLPGSQVAHLARFFPMVPLFTLLLE